MSIEFEVSLRMSLPKEKKNSILLTEVLHHSSGRGSTSEGATPSCITDSRSFILGLSNKVLFDFEIYWEGG